MKIIFVCHGNICRSPMAEFVFKYLARKAGCEHRFEISSAAVSYEDDGSDIYPPAKRTMDAHGIPYGPHAAHRISAEEFDDADLVIIMDESNRRLLERITGKRNAAKVRMLMEYASSRRSVADPWYTGDFETAYNDILTGCRGMIKELA